jgi:Fe-S-cluster containining protein
MNSDKKNKNLCEGCTICCEHIAIEIDSPETKEDLSKWLDYLRYNNVWIFIEDNGGWSIEFRTRCKQLDSLGHCKAYSHRPPICKSYDQDECEKYGEGEFCEHLFKNDDEFLNFIEKDEKWNKIWNSK